MKKKRLGEVLRERGQISSDDLTRVIESQEQGQDRDNQGSLMHLGELLLKRKLVSKNDLTSALTEVTRVPYTDCAKLRKVDSAVLSLIPQALAKRCCALPIEMEGDTKLALVIAEPQNLQVIDELRFSLGMELVAHFGFREEILAAIEKFYGGAESEENAEAGADNSSAASDSGVEFVSGSSLRRSVNSTHNATHEIQSDLLQKCTPAVRLVASLITTAAKKGATDIHIEPQTADSVVRFRIDGMLRDYQRIPRSMQSSVISRIKILSDMDIAERRGPQDGRFLVKIAGRSLDLRVSTHAHAVRRKSRDAHARSGFALARTRFARLPERNRRKFSADARTSPGPGAGHRTERLGKKHHAVLRAEFAAQTFDQHHYRGRSGEIQRSRREPGAGKYQGGAHVRGFGAFGAEAGSERDHDR